MPKKHIRRPITLTIGILLIFLALADFTETFDFSSINGFQIIMILAGLILILFAFAKSD